MTTATASQHTQAFGTSVSEESRAEFIESDESQVAFVNSVIDVELQKYHLVPMGAQSTDAQEPDHGYSTDQMYERSVRVPVFPVNVRSIQNALVPLQEWEGYVTAIGEDGFTAELVDLTNGEKNPSIETDFSLEDVSEPDRELLREGAVFRWTIGYQTTSAGSKSRVSQIVFRRLPRWTKKEIDAADREAELLLSGIIWE